MLTFLVQSVKVTFKHGVKVSHTKPNKLGRKLGYKETVVAQVVDIWNSWCGHPEGCYTIELKPGELKFASHPVHSNHKVTVEWKGDTVEIIYRNHDAQHGLGRSKRPMRWMM